MNQALEVVKSEPSTDLVPLQVIVHIETSVPLMHPNDFAESVRRSNGVVGGWMDNGYLPTVKVGKYTMINLVLLTENLKKGYVL